jgi:hypothetical protein
LFGSAAYSFASSYYRNNSWLLEPRTGPRGIVHFEEMIVSGDIISDPTEFVVDLLGVELGEDLYKKVTAKSRGEVILDLGIKLRDCPTPGEPEKYGVFLAGEYILVGQRSVLLATPACELQGWGRDCSKTVFEVTDSFTRIDGPYDAYSQAVEAYCSKIDPCSVRRVPLTQGWVAEFDGKAYWISNAPDPGKHCPKCGRDKKEK